MILNWLLNRRKLQKDYDAVCKKVELFELASSKKEKAQHSNIEALSQIVAGYKIALKKRDVRRLTLSELRLRTDQVATLKAAGSQFRQALFDAGEHVCLTEESECCRRTAVKLRNYYMDMTLGVDKKNAVPSDETAVDKLNKRHDTFFDKKDVPPS